MRLLLADRVKSRADSFLAPVLPALEARWDVRFVSLGPSAALAEAIAWADMVWLEWCWDHAVWATREGVLGGRPCILRLHSIEALQTDYPERINWTAVDAVVTVGADIAAVLRERVPTLDPELLHVVANGIDLERFREGTPNRFNVAWVGHLEPKKNPMLLLQVAHRLLSVDPRYRFHVAGAATDLRTARYVARMVPLLGLTDAMRFDGHVADMPAWYADKGVLLSTTMYESFGLNIGEAMATGAYPVIHDFPGAETLWPRECLFGSIDEAVALLRAARPGLYRDWVAERYALDTQCAAICRIIEAIAHPRRAVA